MLSKSRFGWRASFIGLVLPKHILLIYGSLLDVLPHALHHLQRLTL
jgi:hypothetical protein